MTDLGQTAYEAYAASVDWRSVKGDRLPKWAEQSKRIQAAWWAAAEAVAEASKPVNPLGIPTE
jgi:hypothetical protein